MLLEIEFTSHDYNPHSLNRVIVVEWVQINSAEITEGLPTVNCPCTSHAT